MDKIDQTTPSKKAVWAGRILSALPALILLLSGISALFKPADVITEFTRLGYPESAILGIGITEVACAILYAIPQTSVLGAILATGYLGGATATHVRVGDPIFKIIMPVIFGVVIWAGLFLRDGRLRKLLPLRD